MVSPPLSSLLVGQFYIPGAAFCHRVDSKSDLTAFETVVAAAFTDFGSRFDQPLM
jgi:hypothetical protein